MRLPVRFAIQYKSRFVYRGFAVAFMTSDRKSFLPVKRKNLRKLDPSTLPAEVTRQMIARSEDYASGGSVGPKGNPIAAAWHAHGMPDAKNRGSEWAGISSKNKAYLFAFEIDFDDFKPLDR